MGPLTAHEQASHVVAEQGTIIVEGPAGVAFTMTPDAAEETAHRLMAAVAEARNHPVGQSAPEL